MFTLALIRTLHFIGIFLVIGSLFTENAMIKKSLNATEARLIAKVDAFYGLGAVLATTGGILLWFIVGKPAVFYTSNWVFLTKISVFGVVGLLSIYPTVFFIKNRLSEEAVEVPSSIRKMVRMEGLLLLIIPFLATAMALGYGNG